MNFSLKVPEIFKIHFHKEKELNFFKRFLTKKSICLVMEINSRQTFSPVNPFHQVLATSSVSSQYLPIKLQQNKIYCRSRHFSLNYIFFTLFTFTRTIFLFISSVKLFTVEILANIFSFNIIKLKKEMPLIFI